MSMARRTVERLCRTWPAEVRDDILQDAMLRVLQVAEHRATETLPAAYLHRVVYSATIDELRRRRRRKEISLDGQAGGVDMTDELHELLSPERAAYWAIISEGILDCLRHLKEDRRAALALNIQGYSARETAMLMGWNVKKARNLVVRGRSDLKICLLRRGLYSASAMETSGAGSCCDSTAGRPDTADACETCLAVRPARLSVSV